MMNSHSDSTNYSLRNNLLVALPGTQDPIFAHSVILVCDHSDQGAMGVVITRPLDVVWGDVFDQLSLSHSGPRSNTSVLIGGPVSRERGFILHPPGPEKWQSTLQVSDEVCLTVSRDILEAMAAGKGPEKAQLILGYSGWEAGQLEDEMAQNGWLTVPADASVIFDVPVEQRWSAAAQQLGVDMNLISTRAGHA